MGSHTTAGERQMRLDIKYDIAMVRRLLDLRGMRTVIVVPRDAEVAAQMEQVDRTEVSGHGHERQRARRFSQHHGTTNIYAVHYDPDVG